MSLNGISIRLALVTIASGLFGCAAASPTDGQGTNQDANEAAAVTEQAASVAPVQAYFTVTRDQRMCASPKCGGYWLKAVNQLRTICADGTSAASCYVAAIDYRALGGDPGITAATVVVKGKLSLVDYGSIGKLGQLTAVDAWGSATAVVPTGTYYRLASTGIVCVAAPCFNITAEGLNLGTSTTLSSYDLRKAGATAAQLAAAAEAMNDGRLLAAGNIVSVPSTTKTGRQLNASQFFLPPLDFCYSDSDCTAVQKCNASTVCLPPPGCGPDTACPTVCTGYCIPLVANCVSDAECSRDQFCKTDPCLPPPDCIPGSVCPTVCGGICTGRI